MRSKILLTVLLLCTLFLAYGTQLDDAALKVHDETMQRAMAAFVMAKGLNAVISLVQGTQLSFTPVGVGLTFSIGEVLDPLNDLVERFSWVMLFAAVSLGVQKLLLAFSATQMVAVSLTAALVVATAMVWFRPLQSQTGIALAARLLVLLLVLRFATIGFVYLQTLGYEHLMARDYENASRTLESTEATLQEIERQRLEQVSQQASPQPDAEASWMPKIIDRATAMFDDAAQSYDRAVAMMDIPKLRQSVDAAQEHVINLITIFVVQTVLMPLLYLWMLLRLLGWLFGPRFDPAALYARLSRKQL